MDIQKIHKGFIFNRFSLILTLLAFIAIRLMENPDKWSMNFWLIIVIQIGIALFLLYLTQAFVIIRQRTLLPAFFYLLFVGTNSAFFYDLRGSVSTLIIVLCLFLFLCTYQNSHAQGTAFNISFLLTLGSFYWQPLLLFFPFFWYGMFRFRSLNFRTFFASLVGFIVIYWLLFVWSIYKDDLNIFLNQLPDFRAFYPIQTPVFTLREWISIGFSLFLYFLAIYKIFMSGISEKIRAVTTLGSLSVFTVYLFLLLFLQSSDKFEWALIIYLPLSFLFAHLFTLSTKKITSWLFFITIGLCLINFWM